MIYKVILCNAWSCIFTCMPVKCFFLMKKHILKKQQHSRPWQLTNANYYLAKTETNWQCQSCFFFPTVCHSNKSKHVSTHISDLSRESDKWLCNYSLYATKKAALFLYQTSRLTPFLPKIKYESEKLLMLEPLCMCTCDYRHDKVLYLSHFMKLNVHF